jgi:hypothetical protein
MATGAGLAQPEDSSWVSYYNGEDGWFAFQGPQRAMLIDPADFNLHYPFAVESLKIWWYWGMGSRTDTAFTFRVYEGDGISVLFQSETLYAPSTNWTYYALAAPVVIDSGRFWIATTHRRTSPYANPYVNVDTGPTTHSYYGSPGAWTLDNVGEFCFFAWVREITTGVSEGHWAGPSPKPALPTLVRRVRSDVELRDATGRLVQPRGALLPGVYFERAGSSGLARKVLVVR